MDTQHTTDEAALAAEHGLHPYFLGQAIAVLADPDADPVPLARWAAANHAADVRRQGVGVVIDRRGVIHAATEHRGNATYAVALTPQGRRAMRGYSSWEAGFAAAALTRILREEAGLQGPCPEYRTDSEHRAWCGESGCSLLPAEVFHVSASALTGQARRVSA